MVDGYRRTDLCAVFSYSNRRYFSKKLTVILPCKITAHQKINFVNSIIRKRLEFRGTSTTKGLSRRFNSMGENGGKNS